ncbi:MAG: citrate lyase holo-[acyl-carrier protein] synthase [Peptostreptococcaceae bacterium]|nr:citrate lyase holo-[acyl-carrier protein] synthase [Peptostreptococcaceae bacterium]
MNIFSKGKEQGLEDILTQREWRANRIAELLAQYRQTVVCYKLNIPGSIKNNEWIKNIFAQGKQAILEQLALSSCIYKEEKISDAGDELFLVVQSDAVEVKKIMCLIEENHYFGRLFDIDVLTENESVSRTQIGYAERKCLICENKAVLCGRNRTHTVVELQNKISEMYFVWTGIS